MVEAKKISLQMQPVRPMIDVSFWLQFTKQKLDVWKLAAPATEVTATVSLPNNPNMPSDLVFSKQSFSAEKKKVIGGLISSEVKGTFIHTNTIEEYNALDVQKLVEQEKQRIAAGSDVHRFILVVFGDLKKYVFTYRFCMVEMDTSHINQVKANRLTSFISKEEIATLQERLHAYFQRSEDQIEPMAFWTGPAPTFEPVDRRVENGFLCFLDSSPKLPSSLLGNYVATQTGNLNVLLIREKLSKLSQSVKLDHSLMLNLEVDEVPQVGWKEAVFKQRAPVNLQSQMDPTALAEQAVGLNLKLMKWRQSPELNLEVLTQTKCLLLGSGSLGCQVARNLLSWGYTKITFVDNGRVSYSNPVRQCLFTFEDSNSADNFKAPIAAKRLAEIYPKVETRGINMSIPMPGHSVGDDPEQQKKVVEDFYQLEELIKEHDVIFLLLDSREARWLPTVLAQVHNKVCLTVALGFDTFLVMRHGLSPSDHQASGQPSRLGCYFCNDVVAPRNSLQDRTLDQQCTVSRPALCTMASALGVELLTSILNHPAGNAAKAHEETNKCDRSILGILPQQLRGDLNTFSTVSMYGENFDKCTGCSPTVSEKLLEGREDFIIRACNDPDFLEDLTGITAMNANINFDDIESFGSFDDEDMSEV